MRRLLLLSVWIIAPFAIGSLYQYASHEPVNAITDSVTGSVDEPSGFPLTRILLLGTAMVTGIFFNFLVDATKQRVNANPKPSYAVLLTRQQPSIIIALLSSPIVFYAIYSIVKSEPDNVIALLIAFQNGFFWQSVLSRKKK